MKNEVFLRPSEQAKNLTRAVRRTSKRTHGTMAPVRRIFIPLQIYLEKNSLHNLKD